MNARLLIIDDEATIRSSLEESLAAEGYAVDIAESGEEALAKCHGNTYDLLITDIDMPRMTGIELVTMLKADPRLEAIPVVIVSYKDREEDKVRGLEAGAEAYDAALGLAAT